MEWHQPGLMVTLIWLYLEILRLMSKLRSRNKVSVVICVYW